MATWIETKLNGAAGSVATVQPDYIVLNDSPAHKAVEAIDRVANPEKVLVIYDHDVPTGRPEAAAILKQNLAFAKKYGCKYIQSKGVGYQYIEDELVIPGQVIIVGGTHSSIFGAKGALGVNVSVPELARIIETGRYSTIIPETVCVKFTGALPENVRAMDAALTMLKDVKDLDGKAIEIYAPTMTQHERETVCGMACITGGYTAVAVKDEPENAVEINLAQVKPMVMLPCESRKKQAEAEIKALDELDELKGVKLQAGQIGGFNGGTIEDLRKAAKLIEGKTLARGFRLTICPATSTDYIKACDEGILTKLIDFGAQISAAGDHSVVVQGAGAMGPNEILLTTGLHTFTGAMGVESSKVYCASVESVMAAAVSGAI